MRGDKEIRIGNYRIIKHIGHGGFADVYLGEHIYLKRPTAIKVLRVGPDLVSSDLEQFLIEARNITRLEHPNIVRIFDFGLEGNEPYLAMSYAPNGSLQARHRLDAILDPTTIIDYVRQITAALQFTHDNRIVHCDVKPANMLLDRDNKVLLSDFGIAILVQNSLKTREAVGTLIYMAPEQLAGKPEFASDQYSLALVVYGWLSGHVAFQGRNPFNPNPSPPKPLRHFVPDIPQRVEQVVAKAMSRRPQDRFARIKDFALALEEAIRGNMPTALPPRPSTQGTIPPPLPAPPPPSVRLPPASSLLPGQVSRPGAPFAPPPEPGKRVDEPPVQPVSMPTPRSLPRVLPASKPGQLIFHEHTAWISALAWSPLGAYIASGSWDATVQVWNASTGEVKLTYHGHEQTVKALTWSPDGEYIASGSWDTRVRVWRALTGEEIVSYSQHKLQIEDVKWSPDGRYVASAGHDCKVHIWKTNGKTIQTYDGHTGPIWSLSWSPNGQHIASASHDGSVHVWEVATGKNVLIHRDYEKQQMAAVAWSPNGQYIASASHDGSVHIWYALHDSPLLRYQDNTGAAKALNWSPDGKYLASAVKQVQIWQPAAPANLPANAPIFTYTGHSNWVNALVWSPDGSYIASGGDDKTVHVWRVSPPPVR